MSYESEITALLHKVGFPTGSILTINKARKGYRNSNWKIILDKQTIILRLGGDFAAAEREAHTLRKLNGRFNSPKLLYFNPSETLFNSRPVLILEHKSGEPLLALQSADIDFMARFLRHLHEEKYAKYNPKGIDPVRTGNHSDIAHKELLDINNNFENLPQQIFSELLNIKTAIPQWRGSEFSLVHGDFSPKNILNDGNDYSVIDWEKAKISDPASEVASTLFEIDLFSQAAGEHKLLFLDLYQKDYSGEFKQRVKFYYLLSILNYFQWKRTDGKFRDLNRKINFINGFID